MKKMVGVGSTREKLILAAVELLSEGGGSNLSASKVVAIAGVSKGTLFHYFTTMDDLLFGVLQYFFEHFSDELKEQEVSNLEQFLQALGEKTIAEISQESELFMAFLSFYERAIYDDNYRDQFKAMLDEFIAYVEERICFFCIEDVSKKDIEPTAMLITLVCDSMGIYYKIFEDKKRFEEYWNNFVDLILLQLGPFLKE